MKEQRMCAQTGKVGDGGSATQGKHKGIIRTWTSSSFHHPLFKVDTYHIGIQHVEASTPLECAHRNHHVAWIGPAASYDPEEWSKEQIVVTVYQENAGIGFPSQPAIQLKCSAEPSEARAQDQD